MDTELLKTFMEVSRTRHFGRAAENLYLTQSAVSFRIRQLEGLLGVELFSRQRNNIQLTEAGEKLMPLAENSVLLEQRIRQEIATINGKRQQFLLGATPSVWDIWLQQHLSACINALPNISLTALTHSSGSLVRQVLERTLDLVFVLDAPKVDEITSVEVREVPLQLVSTVPHETWQEALADNYVLVDWGAAFYNQHAQELKTAHLPILRTNTGLLALDCLLQNGGSAYLPEPLVQPLVAQGKLTQVKQAPEFTLKVYASFHTGSGREELIKRVIELVTG